MRKPYCASVLRVRAASVPGVLAHLREELDRVRFARTFSPFDVSRKHKLAVHEDGFGDVVGVAAHAPAAVLVHEAIVTRGCVRRAPR